MACYLRPSVRDVLVRLFRAEVYRRTQYVEFIHQAEFRLASEGLTLTEQVIPEPDIPPRPFDPNNIKPSDYTLRATPVKIMVPCEQTHPDGFEVGETGNWARYEWRIAEPRRFVRMTADGPEVQEGIIAHKVSDLAAFKAGKSKSIGMWATGFACLPGATIDMLGLTYETSEHEYTYLCEALMSGDKPMVQKSQIAHFYDDVKQGRMYLELKNGCTFGVRSWKNKDALRGGQITVYIFNEIYQLPGLAVYTGHAQNLRAEKGYAAFTSTPDRPWVKVLHKMGHGHHPDWHCSCATNAYVNPITFDLAGFMADVPDWAIIKEHAPALLEMCVRSGLQPGALMSKEKFLISWLGQLGGFVGSVYAFDRIALTCYPHTHPALFRPAVVAAWNARQAQLEALSAGT